MKCTFVLFILTISVYAEEWEGFSSSNNQFATSLYKEILKISDGNFLVSPFSAELVLAFVQAGAKNETAQELQAVLRLPQDQEKIQSAIKTLLSTILQNENNTLQVANKIYVKDGCPIKDEFIKIATDVFSSEIEAIDFSETTQAAKIMNKWVEDHTKNKIHELINPNTLTRNARAVLINALYFQGDWLHPFGTKFTETKDFHVDDKTVQKVETMHLKNGLFNYYESSKLNAKFLEMPFKNQDASMVLILPNKKNGLTDLEKHIEHVLLPQKFVNSFIHVALPKFKVESSFDFTEILKNLGVIRAFDQDQANLSGISEDKLHVSKVAQKAYINVSEAGVEAAAASYDVISPRIYALLDFTVDHPFIFYVKVKNMVIFVGRIVKPIE